MRCQSLGTGGFPIGFGTDISHAANSSTFEIIGVKFLNCYLQIGSSFELDESILSPISR